MGKDPSEIRDEIERTRARMGETIEALSYKADVPSRAREAVNERVETVRETVRGRAAQVMSGIQNVTGQARQQMGSTLEDARHRAGDAWNAGTRSVPRADEIRDVARRGMGIAAENPIGLAVGAAAVGFLAGLMLPVSEYERRKVGPIRDELIDRAQSVGGSVVEHGKEVVRETAQAALDAAQQSSQSHAQEIAREVTRPPEA
jgi:ElaB/YqjD/DUF883 family membrane-anchored ribosome-binding protein